MRGADNDGLHGSHRFDGQVFEWLGQDFRGRNAKKAVNKQGRLPETLEGPNTAKISVIADARGLRRLGEPHARPDDCLATVPIHGGAHVGPPTLPIKDDRPLSVAELRIVGRTTPRNARMADRNSDGESGEVDEYEEITSDEVDRVVEQLERLIDTVASENIKSYLEDAVNNIFFLVYNDEDAADAA